MLQLDNCLSIFSDVKMNNNNETKSKSSSLVDNRLGDMATSKIIPRVENSADIVDVPKTSLLDSSSLIEKQQKLMKTETSPRSLESDKITIVPTQKTQHSEIITCDVDENIAVGDQAKVSR